MKAIGIICEYNPFHNGHIYHINKIKERYPDHLIILALNGYFLERGEISLLTKEDKVKIALDYVDLIVNLPFVYGTQSADNFAYGAVSILNIFQVERIIFGSESNNIEYLKKALKDIENIDIVSELKSGKSYASVSLKNSINKSNDILGISYIKAINKINKNIIPETIKRTNNYYGKKENIASASYIRKCLKNNKNIEKYLPKNIISKLTSINDFLFFNLLKYEIITNPNLKEILMVDEGIEYKLKKEIIKSKDLKEFTNNIKSKRFTFNKINRMFIHIICHTLKKDIDNIKNIDYIQILGFNQKGRSYLNNLSNKKDITSLTKNYNSTIYLYELKAALIYEIITGKKVFKFEKNKKPIIK